MVEQLEQLRHANPITTIDIYVTVKLPEKRIVRKLCERQLQARPALN